MPQSFRVRTTIAGGPGGTGLSTMYFETGGGLLAEDAADAVVGFWNDCKTAIVNDLTMSTETSVYVIDGPTGQPTGVETVTGGSISGTSSSDPAAWAQQGLIEWRTGNFIDGREIRGRTFIPGPSYDLGGNGVPTSLYKSKLQTAIDNFLGNGLIHFQVYSRTHHLAAEVVAASIWPKWAVLRSRRD